MKKKHREPYRRPATPIEAAAKYYKESRGNQKKNSHKSLDTDLSLDAEIEEAVAIIQNGWDEQTKLLRLLGVTKIPSGLTKEKLIEQLQQTEDLTIPFVRVCSCDRRKFRHSLFTRGGSARPNGHTPENVRGSSLPNRYYCPGIPPYVYTRLCE